MKIYILPAHTDFQPNNQPFLYPKYNDDYGVEQDFLEFLKRQPNLLTKTANEADWHYLPIFWTRYHLNRNRRPDGLLKLQSEVNRLILDDKRTFTVCQFDDGPIADIGSTLKCLSSRKNATVSGIDIPLLASPLPYTPKYQTPRKYLASFQGQFKNHEIRFELSKILMERQDVWYQDGDLGIETFVDKIHDSYIGICPRGYGGSSFRLFEVMQLGRVPLIIGDVDPRPFRRILPWDQMSFYIEKAEDITKVFDFASKCDLQKMGKSARKTWGHIQYQKWCSFLLGELSQL